MKIITAKLPAFITHDNFDPRSLIDGDPAIVLGDLKYYDREDMSSVGWVKCGVADITLLVSDPNEIISNKVESLKATKNAIIAKAEAEATRIEGKIQELLCLEYKPEDV